MIEDFGKTADGRPVQRVSISGGGLNAAIINWGATLQDLRLDGHPHPLVLGVDHLEPYQNLPLYLGAIVGRFANRIANGRFEIDGTTWQADTDFIGKHTLHGGAAGFDKRLWTIADHGESHVRLTYSSPDGEMGFPGRLDASCTYRLTGEGRLSVLIEATTDALTLCNLSQHSYFNLDDGGASPVLDHSLQMPADTYLPVDEELIPTGEIAPVEGTRFDFRALRRIRNGGGASHQFYDHNLCLSDALVAMRTIATAKGPRSGIEMQISSNQPGLQFFDGAPIEAGTPGIGGIFYGPYSGFCLEPQGWPDSPNRPGFPQNILRPGETYRNEIGYRFAIS